MFDNPPKIHKSDLDPISYLLESEVKRFLNYEHNDLQNMRGMTRMVNEIGYEVEFKVKLKKR